MPNCFPQGVEVEGKLAKDLQFWRAERPDEWTMDDFIRRADAMEKEITSLRAQVEELSKYPKAAVTSVYLAGVHSGECNAAGIRHILDSDQIKAIFKEKQGVGECTLQK